MDQNEGVGGCAFLEDKPNSRYIFYLVTKSVSSGKPTYESFSKSLVAWKNKCQQLAVTKVAIPHIGCGLDRLDWDRVKDYINSTFENTNIEICAYDFNAVSSTTLIWLVVVVIKIDYKFRLEVCEAAVFNKNC